MGNIFSTALQKIVLALESEKIDYMIVGGFAVSYHNRARTTNDIDLILQIHPHQVSKILKHFPQWQAFEESFKEDVASGLMFNITDFDTGIRYDFMTFQDSEYECSAFERCELVSFFGIKCYMSSKEDLIVSKFRWYNISSSDKQMEDLQFLLLDKTLDMDYLKLWTERLKLKTYGLDYWGKKIHISKESATRHISIINGFSSEKRLKIALDFANMGINQTHDWIKSNHPEFSELEVRMEFVRLLYYETASISEKHWEYYKKVLEDRIRKDWSKRFRKMMEAKNWTYKDVAKYGRFSSGKVIEATISRGLPSFAKLAVVLFEQNESARKF